MDTPAVTDRARSVPSWKLIADAVARQGGNFADVIDLVRILERLRADTSSDGRLDFGRLRELGRDRRATRDER